MIKREKIISIAKLSKLELSEEEITKYQKELSEILDFFEKINEVNTSKIEKSSRVIDIENALREDLIIPFENNLLSCSNQKIEDNQVSVKSVL